MRKTRPENPDNGGVAPSLVQSVLLVDDESQALEVNEVTLRAGGISSVLLCQDSRKVLTILSQEKIGVLLLDLAMPHLSGEELLPRIAEEYPEIPIIVVTGRNELDVAVRCMKAGAYDYIVKPVEETRMVTSVLRAIEIRQWRSENEALRHCVFSEKIERPAAFEGIIASGPPMRPIFQYLEAIASTTRPVLITGESGVGKELIARAVHRLSGRTGKLVAVNVAGLDGEAFSDTLFGHVQGAFTGAEGNRAGIIKEASGGTLLLDEIGDLDDISQVKLLRLLQENEYYPLGSDIPRPTDARFVVTTNRDLDKLQASGKFRRDLYFRVQTHQVHIPPLRERTRDLPALLDHFMSAAAAELGKRKPTPPRELLSLLSAYHFPGNVRELESMVFNALSRHRSKILSMATFEAHIAKNREQHDAVSRPSSGPSSIYSGLRVIPTLAESMELLIDDALRRSEGNQTLAAKLLGISQSSLNKRLRRSVK